MEVAKVKKLFVLVILLLSFAVVMPVQTVDAGGKVTIALRGEPPTMDPHKVSNYVGAMVWRWAYDSLLNVSTKTGKKEGWLATSWKKKSHKEVIFKLRKGVRFSDGSKMNCSNAVFALKRVKASKRQAYFFRPTKSAECIDDYTLRWINHKADNGLESNLTRYAHPISHKIKELGLKGRKLTAYVSRNTHGSGPYTLISSDWQKNQKMVFRTNPLWWNNKAWPNRPDTVVLRRIKSAAVRTKAIQAGDVDIVMGILPQFIPQLEKDPNTKIKAIPAVRIMFMSFFSRNGGPFADERVRRAANLAIDAEKIRKTLLGGRADLFGQMYHPWNYSGYDPNRKPWHGYNPAKSKALLKEAGYGKGFKMELIATNGRYPADKQTCEASAGYLKAVGINATCNAQIFPLYKKSHRAYNKGKKKNNKYKGVAAFYMGYGNGGGNPGSIARGTNGCKGPWSGICIKELNDAIDDAALEPEPPVQQKKFENVTDLMKKHSSYKIFFKIHDVFGMRTNIEWLPRHDELMYPWEITKK